MTPQPTGLTERVQTEDSVGVVFIAGYGRSGTTLLDSILGQHPGVVSVGELRHIWSRGLLHNHLCGCGVAFLDCPFWHEVCLDAFGSSFQAEAARLRALQGVVDRMRYVPWMLSVRKPAAYAKRWQEYTAALTTLYRSILDISGSRLIVDSSKDPSHGFLLRSMPNVRLHVVHMLRDSRGVAYSWSRLRRRPEITRREVMMPRYGPWKSATEWVRYNVSAHVLGLGRVRYARVKYEDLVRDAKETVRGIASALGIELAVAPAIRKTAVRLERTHTVSGNPSRFRTGDIALRLDAEWVEHMTSRDFLLVSAVTAPLLVGYGYPLLRPATRSVEKWKGASRSCEDDKKDKRSSL